MLLYITLLCVAFQLTHQRSIPTFKNGTIMLVKGSFKEYEVVVNEYISSNDIRGTTGISELSITQQDIPELNEGFIKDYSFYGLKTPIKITFTRDNIEIIRKKAISRMSELTEIDLSENKIIWIEAMAFSEALRLKKVNLMKNKITLLPASFHDLHSLQQVILSYNELENFNQEWFSDTPELRWLWLNNNRIRSIPKYSFIGLPSLTDINLQNNELETVDKDAFKGLSKLERIYFDHNKLKTFDVHFDKRSKMTYMSLKFNRLTYISDETLKILKTSMLKLWITSNPWQCACFDKLIQWGTFNDVEVAWKCNMTDTVPACVIPKTYPNVCKERKDEDFHEGYADSFVSEGKCVPVADN